MVDSEINGRRHMPDAARDYPAAESEGMLQRLGSLMGGVDSTRESDDAWVMTYMDLLTLLLTLFVLLLAYAQRDTEEYRAVTEAMAVANSDKGLATRSTPPVKEPVTPVQGQRRPDTVLQDMSRDLQQQLDSAGLGGSVALQLKDRQLDIQLNEKILFPSGEARFGSEAFRALDPIVSILRGQPYSITVEGHTDNVPIATERFPSNWELSVARAAYVVRYLIDEGIASDRLKAVGYADTRPLESNDTAEGRRTNRRVTLVIHQKGSEQATSGESS